MADQRMNLAALKDKGIGDRQNDTDQHDYAKGNSMISDEQQSRKQDPVSESRHDILLVRLWIRIGFESFLTGLDFCLHGKGGCWSA